MKRALISAGLILAWPNLALAEEPKIAVQIEIEGEGANALRKNLQPKVANAIVAGGAEYVDDPSIDFLLQIKIRQRTLAVYTFDFALTRDAEPIELEHSSFDCRDCGVDDLYARVTAEIPAVVQHTRKITEPEPAPAETKPRATPFLSAEPSEHPPEMPRTFKKVGSLGWAGVALVGAGILTAATGGGLALRGEKAWRDPDDYRYTIETDYRVDRGMIALWSGLGIIGVGLVFVVVDQTALRKKRRDAVSLHPTLAPSFAGLELRGGF